MTVGPKKSSKIGRRHMDRLRETIKDKRSGIRLEKISILRVLKKKTWTPPRFLHRGPKKAVEHDSDIHFDLT